MPDALADRLATSEQLARYANSFDTRDIEAWGVAVFTPEAAFEIKLGLLRNQSFALRGAEQLRVFARNSPRILHHITSLVFDEMLAESARSRAIVLGTWVAPGDENPVRYTHRMYEHRWSKTAGTRLIAHQLFISRGYHASAFGKSPDREGATPPYEQS